jgi:hypothetical protein
MSDRRVLLTDEQRRRVLADPALDALVEGPHADGPAATFLVALDVGGVVGERWQIVAEREPKKAGEGAKR